MKERTAGQQGDVLTEMRNLLVQIDSVREELEGLQEFVGKMSDRQTMALRLVQRLNGADAGPTKMPRGPKGPVPRGERVVLSG